jgi:thymidylate synthase
MFISKSTLDDLMREVYIILKDGPFDIESSRSKELGKLNERFGVMLELTNPRARLSKTETRGKAFSALGELIWYLSGDDSVEFIKVYIPKYEDESHDGKNIYGAYGPRLINACDKFNQLENVISLLRTNKNSKRAVIQLFEARDISPNVPENGKSIPCTCTLQFLIRDEKLSLIVFMRSNDAYIGLQHDIFAFTMLQEIVASAVGVELGVYKHCVGSLHLYEKKREFAEQYLSEGLMPTVYNMPQMPHHTSIENIKRLIKIEEKIRHKDAKSDFIDPLVPELMLQALPV